VKVRNLFVLIVIILTVSPFIIVVANQIELNKVVRSSYLNGLITACGIFVAFITASVVSRSKELDDLIFNMMRMTLILFTGSVISLSYQLIVADNATIFQLALFSSTLTLASLTAWNILNTLYMKSKFSRE
jgi:cytochrome bd-type quinol oxidase subunit 2